MIVLTWQFPINLFNINNYISEKIKELQSLLNSDFRWSSKNLVFCHIQNKQRQLKELQTLKVHKVKTESAEARAET